MSRTRSALAAIAATLLAVSAFAPEAHAAPLDANAANTLTIHKCESPADLDLPNNGTLFEDFDCRILDGVTFAMQPVTGIDLATNAGWQAARALSDSFDGTHTTADAQALIAAAGYGLGPATEQSVTDGTAVFDAPIGMYLVHETSWPAGITPAAPFLVTLPITDPGDSAAWLHDVHVYPKNVKSGIDKTVSDADDMAFGDKVVFTISGDIPDLDLIDGYRITDQLDPRLTHTSTTVTLDDGTSFDAADYTATHTGGLVTVAFTPAGLVKLAANQAARVQVEITVAVNGLGEIANEALIYPNLGSFNVEAGQPGGPVASSPVITKWGSIDIHKTDTGGKPLAGAEFQLFRTEADAQTRRNPITLAGSDLFKVDGGGKLTLAGLRFSAHADDKQIIDTDGDGHLADEAGFNTYWLVETKAPDGYEMLTAPIWFTIDEHTTSGASVKTVRNVELGEPQPVPSPGPTGSDTASEGATKPVGNKDTGGSGHNAIYGIGALMLAAGVALISARRRDETARV